MALNLAILPLAARRAVLSVFQTVANLFKGKSSGPAEATQEPDQAADPTTALPEHPDPTDKPSSAPAPRSDPAVPDTPPPAQTPDAVLRGFAGPKSMRTWQNQMIKRDWTASQIEEAIQGGEHYPAENRVNPGNGATRYVHPKDWTINRHRQYDGASDTAWWGKVRP